MARAYTTMLEQARALGAALTLDALGPFCDATPGVVLLDVREGDEWRLGHIPGALHLPRGHLEQRIEALVPDRDTPLAVYCAAGHRAALAAATLRAMGYTAVHRVDPGFDAWKARGLPVRVPRVLTEAQRARYDRHLRLPEVGATGQAALLDARVALVGVGGLGSPVALYLAAAGVGTLALLDADTVDVSNLQRQVIHRTDAVHRRKVDSAAEAIAALNPDVRVVRVPERVTADNAAALLAGYDVIVDGSDNFPTRYLLNDAARTTPVVHGSVSRFEGQVTTFVPGGPCYRCLFPSPPPPGLGPSCQEAGVLGVLPGVVGLLQATEVLKLLLQRGDTLVGRMLCYDALAMEFYPLRYRRDPRCPACGDPAHAAPLGPVEEFCADRGAAGS